MYHKNKKETGTLRLKYHKNRAAGIPHPTVLAPHEVRPFQEIPAKKKLDQKPVYRFTILMIVLAESIFWRFPCFGSGKRIRSKFT